MSAAYGNEKVLFVFLFDYPAIAVFPEFFFAVIIIMFFVVVVMRFFVVFFVRCFLMRIIRFFECVERLFVAARPFLVRAVRLFVAA